MASGTITGTTANERIDSKIEWTSTPNNDGNYSNLTLKLYFRRNNTGFSTEGTGTFTLKAGSFSNTSASIHLKIQESWVLAHSATFKIDHDPDGGKSIAVSASGSLPPSSLTAVSCSKTISLDAIPRASSIDSISSSVNIGSACTIKWTPASKDFQYKVTFDWGSYDTTTSYIKPSKTSQHSYSYTIPNAVANEVTDDTSKKINVTLTTYNASGSKIGSASTKSITIKVPQNATFSPSVTATFEPSSDLEPPFNSLYIQGKSRVQGAVTAEGKYGADIENKRIYVALRRYNSPFLSDVLTQSGKVSLLAGCTDSRGYDGLTEDKYINVIPYSTPRLLAASGQSDIVCARCDSEGNLSDSGTYLKIIARRGYSQVNSEDGTQHNFCAIQYRYKTDADGASYSSWKTILAKDDLDIDSIETSPIANVVSSITTSYVVQVRAIDDFGETNSRTFNVPTDSVTYHEKAGGKGAAFGKYAEEDNLLDVAEDWDMRVRGGLHVGGRSSVSSLTLGIPIVANETNRANLDDYITPGNYYSTNSSNSQYIDNTPYKDGGFALEVRELQSTYYIRQRILYARTEWVRHWNGSEWTDWVRFLTTTQDSSHADDFVIEAGEKNGWTYKKWKSRTYEMFGYFTLTTTVAGTAQGSLYSSEQFAIPTPFAIDSAVVSGSALSWFIVISGGQASNDSANNIGVRLFRPTAFDVGASMSVRLYVVGKF